MRFGLDVPVSGEYADLRVLSDIACEAERAGWDGVFLQDTFSLDVPAVDPWLALAVLAIRTERVRLGVLMTPLSRRRPWVVARQAATVDAISGGRMVAGFGLGAGERDFTPFGEVWDAWTRASMLDEGLAIVDGLWSGEAISFAGSHYRLQGARVLPSPVQTPRIPIWLAGGWPRRAPVSRAARWDGLYLMTEHQTTRRHLSPQDISDVSGHLRSLGVGDGFDVAFNPSPDNGSDLVAAYARAGATWWVEYDVWGKPDVYLQRIGEGPPRTASTS